MAQKIHAMSILLILIFTFIHSTIGGTILYRNQTLKAGEFLENGPYRFIMQSDCNLVLYKNRTQALWSSRTDRKGTVCRAVMQNDGNLVIYSGTDVVWNSNTATRDNDYRVIVQDDGNVVIYGSALWATNTFQGTRTLNRKLL